MDWQKMCQERSYMKILRLMVPLCIPIFMVACQKDIPEPETKNASIQSYETVQASVMTNRDPFYISHKVKGNNVYVECRIKDMSFRNDGAIMIVSIDGKKLEEINHPAFIIKGLQKGTHQVKLEVIKKNENIATLTNEFKVIIP
jgi:hypothetical protein